MVNTTLQAICLGKKCEQYSFNKENATFNCKIDGREVLGSFDSCPYPDRRGSIKHLPLERQTRGIYNPTREFD